MTTEEKLSALKTAIAPDVEQDDVLSSLLDTAKDLILNKMYPFGYEDGKEIPARYERIQIALAVELFTKRGAEGQLQHAENGTTRIWAAESDLLKRIVPHCGSVISNA